MSRTLAITIGALFVVWLASLAVLLLFLADLVDVPFLVGAIVAQIAVFLVASAILLVSNTRRPAGRDPDAPLVGAPDPFGMTSDELRRGVLLPDQQPYGRRKHDDTQVVKRLIGKFEDEDALRPPPAKTPDWALDLQAQHDDPRTLFPDTPKEEL